MSNICPKGHFSTDTDYCSDCGTPMTVSSASKKPAAPTLAISNADIKHKEGFGISDCPDCPDCMTPRRTGARFCEVCRYDFEQGVSFNGLQNLAANNAGTMPDLAVNSCAESTAPPDQPKLLPPEADIETQSTPTMPTASTVSTATIVDDDSKSAAQVQRLKLLIQVDPALYTEPDPGIACPVDAPTREYHLDLDEQTLGRHFEGKGIHPEIVVQDPGISRRHLKFMRDEKGNITVLDVGSANGTIFNQQTLDVGVVRSIVAGDEFELGMWTRIRVGIR
ncbi:FHA domain-containing protein [Undibacterium sp. SXout20W]